MSKLNRKSQICRYTTVRVLTRSRVFTYDCNRVSRVCVRLSESVEILSGSKLTLEVPHSHTHTHTNIMTKLQHEQTRLPVSRLDIRVMSGHSLRDRNQKLPITISIVCSVYPYVRMFVCLFGRLGVFYNCPMRMLAVCVWQDDIMKTCCNYVPCA